MPSGSCGPPIATNHIDTKTQDEENRNQRIEMKIRAGDHHYDDQSENQRGSFEHEGLICVRRANKKRANKKYVDIRTVKFYQSRQEGGTNRPRSM